MDYHPTLIPDQSEKAKRLLKANIRLVDIDVEFEIKKLDAMFDEQRREMLAAVDRENKHKQLIELRRSEREACLLERARAADELQLELTKAQNHNRLLRNEVTELKQAVMCSICMEARCSTVFQCGHLSCSECSSRLNQCHICRRDILQRSHVFL